MDIHLSVSWLSHWINCGKGSSAEVNFRYFNLTSHLILCSPYPTTSVLPVYRNSCSDSFSIQSLAEVNFSVLLSLLPQYLLPLKTPASTNFAIHESIETTHQQHFHVSLLPFSSSPSRNSPLISFHLTVFACSSFLLYNLLTFPSLLLVHSSTTTFSSFFLPSYFPIIKRSAVFRTKVPTLSCTIVLAVLEN